MVHTLYLINSLPVKSYHGRQICIPMSNIPLFQDTQHETSCVFDISFHIKYEEICFVSHNEDEPFCGINERVQTGHFTPHQDSGFSNVLTENRGMDLHMGRKVLMLLTC